MPYYGAIPILPLLYGTPTPLALEPWAVDAFLDRGPRGKEPRLHLVQIHQNRTTLFAHAETIKRPGSVTWRGFETRPSALVLAGKLAMGCDPRTPDRDRTFSHRTITDHIAPENRAWGRECRPAFDMAAEWWAAACQFLLPDLKRLPRAADALAHPPAGDTLPEAPLRAALDALDPEAAAEARLLPVLTQDVHPGTSIHQRLHVITEVEAAIKAAIPYTTSAHRVPSAVATPLWMGTCDPFASLL